jgi:pimeloyl-ACP methyl ester carboxylesterase
LRLIYGILSFVFISACAVIPTGNGTSTPPMEGSSLDSDTKVETENLFTPGDNETNGSPVLPAGEDFSLTTSDGVKLAAVFYPPVSMNPNTGVLILVHEAYRDRSAWNGFITAAHQSGYAVITFDLRGHGESQGEQVFEEAMDMDLDAVVDWINSSPDLNEEHIAVIGASLGANLALRAGARYPQIKSVVMLSPGMLLWDIGIESAILEYGQRPVLLVASEDDGYPAMSVQRLNDLGKGYDKLVIYPGAGHGTQLVADHPDLIPLILDWLQQTMK